MLKKEIKEAGNTIFCALFWNHYEEYLKRKFSKKMNGKRGITYYVISCEKIPFQGMFGYIDLFLSMIDYAFKHNMIPVIDMKNYPNTYLEKDEVGKINAWDLFFQPIAKIPLETVYAEKYVIGNHMDIDWNNRPTIRGVHNQVKHAFWSCMYAEFVQLSADAEAYCNGEFKSLLGGKEDKILGVLIRGTDIKKCKGHAIQPTIEQVIEKVQNVLREDGHFQYIYLATEEKKNENAMREAFPGKIIVNKRTYYDTMDYTRGLSYVSTDRKNDRYSRGLEYLSSIRLLSKCGGLISGQCGGGFAAYYWNNNQYRYSYFWELGTV